MAPRNKYRFSARERFGVWLAHGSRCFWCREPIDFRRVTVDHILPETLLDDRAELERLRAAYSLGGSYSINDFENWVPAHADCNSRKSDYLESTPSPALVLILQEVGRGAEGARITAANVAHNEKKSRLLARLQDALERDVLSKADVEELVKDLPVLSSVTIDDWEVSPGEITAGSPPAPVVHEASRFVGWTRISFAEKEGLEAALLGRSMGPRHVQACPHVQEVAELMTRIQHAGAVAVVGESGSGKSMVMWHAAYEFYKNGWHVYLLTNVLAANDLPVATPRALLLIDDAQALPAIPVSPALVAEQRAIVVASTASVAGFRDEVRVVPKRCVETIASALRTREAELLPILARLDPRIGDRAMDTPIAFQIESALRSSEFPWQFMFNLGSGELRLAKKLGAVFGPLDAILYSIAAYQLVTRDTPCPVDWLLRQFEGTVRDLPELNMLLDELTGHVELVRTRRGVATPHPRVAGAVLKAKFFGKDSQAATRREILWRVLRDPTFPLVGVRWLIDELPDDVRFFSGLPYDVTAQLVDRCIASSERGGAGYVLAALLRGRSPQSNLVESAIVQHRAVLARWIETCSTEEAHGIADLVNTIINKDHIQAQELIDAVDPSTVRVRIQCTSPVDGYSVGHLLGRLTFGSREWKQRVLDTPETGPLLERFRACDQADVGPASSFIKALAGFGVDLAVELADAISTAIAAAMRENPRDAFAAARDVLWWVLRFGPRFLMGEAEPEERHIAIARAILDSVGVEPLAKAFNGAQRRDWHGLDAVSALIRDASPELATELAGRIDVEPMLPTFMEMASHGEFEIDDVLGALALDEGHEPAATVVRKVCAPRRVLSWRAAVVAPEIATEVVLAGGRVDLPLGAGLPRWEVATTVLGLVYRVNEDAARALLRAHANALADSFVYQQANGGEGASTFLKHAMQLDRTAVIDAMQRMPVAKARMTWPERAKGPPDVRAVLREFIAIACESGGEVAALAADLEVDDG